jgi:hypothetical protein
VCLPKLINDREEIKNKKPEINTERLRKIIILNQRATFTLKKNVELREIMVK